MTPGVGGRPDVLRQAVAHRDTTASASLSAGVRPGSAAAALTAASRWDASGEVRACTWSTSVQT